MGNQQAAAVYREMVETVVAKTLSPKWETRLHFDPPSRQKEFAAWLRVLPKQFPQRGKDLGERLLTAFRHSFESDAKKVVVIGSDCLNLDQKLIGEAFRKLDDHDLVIGPAADGGYYLLGSKRLHTGLFENIRWSTSDVFRQTLEKAGSLATAHLPTLADIDSFEDYLRAKALQRTPGDLCIGVKKEI